MLKLTTRENKKHVSLEQFFFLLALIFRFEASRLISNRNPKHVSAEATMFPWEIRYVKKLHQKMEGQKTKRPETKCKETNSEWNASKYRVNML